MNSWAQQPKAPTPSVYLGLEAASYQYQVQYPSGLAAKEVASPWSVTAGYQVSARWAFQASFLYRYHTFSDTATGTTLAGRVRTDRVTSSNRRMALPLLGCYTLTRLPKRRLQVDVLGGLTFLRAQYAFGEVIHEDGQLPEEHHVAEVATAQYLTGGLGLRYAVDHQHRLEVMGELLVSKNLVHARQAAIDDNVSVGLRYQFRSRERLNKQD